MELSTTSHQIVMTCSLQKLRCIHTYAEDYRTQGTYETPKMYTQFHTYTNTLDFLIYLLWFIYL